MRQESERPLARAMTGPFGDRAAVAVVGEIRSDVAREALKIARVESQSRPVLLVDLLGQGSALDEMFADDDPHGVSDAARYGVSLARVARPVPNADGVFVISGGAETPLADDVLSDHLWGSWSDQCRRAGALLVVAAPADLADVGKAIDQLDGMVMIGDAVAPRTNTPLIGRVPGARRRQATGDNSPRRITPAEMEAVRNVTPGRTRKLVLAGSATAFAAVAIAAAWWATSSIRNPSPTTSPAAAQSIVLPGDPVIDVPAVLTPVNNAGVAPWSVEIASVNSMAGAMARVRQATDSFPVPTFASSRPGGGTATWYRLLAGAFASREQADSLLALLRARGILGPAAGRVVQAPLAWLLEEGVPDDQLPGRLFAWRQQGLPAYALIDLSGNNRVYFGAFETEEDARLLSPLLDSLTLSATLATRVGSIR